MEPIATTPAPELDAQQVSEMLAAQPILCESAAEALKVGDIVNLKSGSPDMTVTRAFTDEEGEAVELVLWHAATDFFKKIKRCPVACLVKQPR